MIGLWPSSRSEIPESSRKSGGAGKTRFFFSLLKASAPERTKVIIESFQRAIGRARDVCTGRRHVEVYGNCRMSEAPVASLGGVSPVSDQCKR